MSATKMPSAAHSIMMTAKLFNTVMPTPNKLNSRAISIAGAAACKPVAAFTRRGNDAAANGVAYWIRYAVTSLLWVWGVWPCISHTLSTAVRITRSMTDPVGLSTPTTVYK